MNLRPYQSRIIADLQGLWARRERSAVVQAPTGCGKTVIQNAVTESTLARGLVCLHVVPSREILAQTAAKLAALRVPFATLSAGRRPDLAGVRMVLAMSQTLARRDDEALQGWAPGLVHFDEAHKLLAQHRDVIERWPNAYRIGWTATPCRTDGEPLTVISRNLIVGPSYATLQAQGFLVPCRTYTGASPDLHGVRMSGGDYDPAGLQAAFRRANLVGSLQETWRRLAGPGTASGYRSRRTIRFCAGVDQSLELVAADRAAGIRSEHLDASGAYSSADRAAALDRLRKGEIDILSNVGLFVEGLDVVEVECVQWATATASPGRWLQGCGRGTRPSPHTGKRDLVVLDHGGNAWVHRPVDWDRTWDLDGPPRPAAGAMAVCPVCGAILAGLAQTCRGCGAARPRQAATRPPPVTVGGTLAPFALPESTHATPARPCPSWAAAAAALWDREEQERQRGGYPLAWTEIRVRRSLPALRSVPDTI